MLTALMVTVLILLIVANLGLAHVLYKLIWAISDVDTVTSKELERIDWYAEREEDY